VGDPDEKLVGFSRGFGSRWLVDILCGEGGIVHQEKVNIGN
jgi:hypothetical protein